MIDANGAGSAISDVVHPTTISMTGKIGSRTEVCARPGRCK